MSARIENLKESDEVLTFTIASLDVSYINAIRRTILSDIPVVCFKTTPYEENKANILINTTRLNNEILKQRLSCIPICIKDLEIPIKNYVLEIDVENRTDTAIYVTTKDFKIRNTTTDSYLDEGDLRKIFPAYVPPTGKGEYFVDFVKLRPKLSEELPGERIKLTCTLTLGTARDDSSFNVTGTCAYGCTPDETKIVEELAKRKQKWEDEGKSEANIAFEAANWKLLEALRYVKRNSFDFILQTVGIYENTEIIIKACQIMMDKFVDLKQLLDKDEIEIKPSDSTLDASYDIILENEDYTIGNILNFELYDIYYRDLKKLSYVGFKKMHPHDSHSILRMAFIEPTSGKDTVRQMLSSVFEGAFKELSHIKGLFDGGRK
uniref:DNA-directed RNA polymerase RpoA/D/Rpb3-type domain-containing protein n=1 Tax=viral metagenome TaxID=1070528 RepID=A0A6C0I774_9ZZZZ